MVATARHSEFLAPGKAGSNLGGADSNSDRPGLLVSDRKSDFTSARANKHRLQVTSAWVFCFPCAVLTTLVILAVVFVELGILPPH